jgi:multiple sugar transport system substrate-binding protein
MSDIILRGITWSNPRGYDPLAAASEVWCKTHTDVKIKWDQLPWYEFEKKILKSLEEGNCVYDLIMFDHPWTGKMAVEKWLVPWDTLSGKQYVDEVRKRVVSPSTESYYLYNHQWALPLDGSCHAGLFRNDLLDVNLLPEDWESVAKWAEVNHDPPHCHALVMSLEGVLGSCLFLSMMAGLRYPAYTDEHARVINRDAAAHILLCLKDLLRFTPPGSSSWGPWDIYERFCTLDDVAYSPSIFAYVNYFGKGPRRGNLRLCPVPGFANGQKGKPILGGVGLGIAHTCSNIKEAKAFGEFLMSEEVQRYIFPAHAGQPSCHSAWFDSGVNQAFNNFYSDLSVNMSTAYIRPRYPAFHQIELKIGRILQNWWDKNVSLSSVLDQLNKIK